MRILLAIFSLCLMMSTSGCKQKDDAETPEDTSLIRVPMATGEILLEVVNGADGKTIPVLVTFPESNNQEPLKAVVVLHGSGGPWDDDDLDGDGIAEICNVGTPSRQTREWRDFLNSNGLIAVFPDSYSPRNTCENEGPYKNPPLKFVISGTFIRNRDAYSVLDLLRRLVWEDTNQPIVNADYIGLMGFSDGGTATISTLYDATATPNDWQWKQSFSGTTYTEEILPPVVRDDGGFRFGVLYYPGSFHNGYYGNICTDAGIYRSYCNMLIHVAEEDPLTENTLCLVNTMIRNGGGDPILYQYDNVGHGFDDSDIEESSLARERTIEFIKLQMDF